MQRRCEKNVNKTKNKEFIIIKKSTQEKLFPNKKNHLQSDKNDRAKKRLDSPKLSINGELLYLGGRGQVEAVPAVAEAERARRPATGARSARPAAGLRHWPSTHTLTSRARLINSFVSWPSNRPRFQTLGREVSL